MHGFGVKPIHAKKKCCGEITIFQRLFKTGRKVFFSISLKENGDIELSNFNYKGFIIKFVKFDDSKYLDEIFKLAKNIKE